MVAVDRCTRLLGHLGLDAKAYRATIRLGVSTVSDDAQGEVIARVDASDVASSSVRAAMAVLTGHIHQVPSAVSAIKVDGRRSYDLVRSGEAVELAARPVTVARFEMIGAARRGDGVLDIDVEVECSSGTYVRALARDLGSALGVGGHLISLRRTRSGPFAVADAVDVYGGPETSRGERVPFPAGLASTVAGALIPAAEAARRAFPICGWPPKQRPWISDTEGPWLPGGCPGPMPYWIRRERHCWP